MLFTGLSGWSFSNSRVKWGARASRARRSASRRTLHAEAVRNGTLQTAIVCCVARLCAHHPHHRFPPAQRGKNPSPGAARLFRILPAHPLPAYPLCLVRQRPAKLTADASNRVRRVGSTALTSRDCSSARPRAEPDCVRACGCGTTICVKSEAPFSFSREILPGKLAAFPACRLAATGLTRASFHGPASNTPMSQAPSAPRVLPSKSAEYCGASVAHWLRGKSAPKLVTMW